MFRRLISLFVMLMMLSTAALAGEVIQEVEEDVLLTADGQEIPCAGVFILRDAVAPTDLLPQLETEQGAIRVSRAMETNMEGVFAAGDCTGAPLQIAKAVGEGHIAALSACEFIDKRKDA